MVDPRPNKFLAEHKDFTLKLKIKAADGELGTKCRYYR